MHKSLSETLARLNGVLLLGLCNTDVMAKERGFSWSEELAPVHVFTMPLTSEFVQLILLVSCIDAINVTMPCASTNST